MTPHRELVMTISLNALEHLGITPDSNIPAVLSEIVANAWDADAKKVIVTIDKGPRRLRSRTTALGWTVTASSIDFSPSVSSVVRYG